MKQLIFTTDASWAGLIMRITAGLIMLPHGAQKLFGWFGGYGFRGTMQYFTETMKLPWLLSLLIILIEFLCSVALILGFATRVSSILFAAIMLGAILTTNYANGFFMNWFGQQNGEGYEYHLLMIGLCMALLVTGSGKFSLDGLIQ